MFIARDDARLHTLVFGGGARSLLAIGGWTAPGDLWHDCFGCLPDWRCVSVEHRGSGASGHTSDPITVDAMADDLLAVAEALELEQCVLAAESAGAGIALAAVRKAPERFTGLVLVGAAWKAMPGPAFDATAERLRADYAGFLRSFIDACLPETDSDDVRRWGLQIMRRSSPVHAIQLMRCTVSYDSQDPLPRIASPSLVLHGWPDRIVPLTDAEELAGRLPDVVFERLAGLGHVPIVTAPAEVARRIDERFGAAVTRA